MSTIYIMEAANLFCGSDPTASKHLTLQELMLPSLEEEYQAHKAGGALVEIEVSLGVKKLEPSFKLAGWDPLLLALFGLGSTVSNTFTAYGSVRDKRTGVAVQSKAVMYGRLGKIAPSAFKRGDLMDHDYAIHEVTHYELFFNGQEMVFWDFFTSDWRIGGVSQNASETQNLMIPTGI